MYTFGVYLAGAFQNTYACLVCWIFVEELLIGQLIVSNVTSVSGLSSSCVMSNVTSVSGLSIVLCLLLCTQCSQFLWIVHCSVSTLVYPMFPVSLDCPFLIAPLVFSIVCFLNFTKTKI